ncbi:MAG: NAD(P)H-dependent oxidoreductase subunit E [Synergistales bacterium]|nr:NAD(P)H-dependent oxidoreductase subunit E [Synergistales bacterium]
MIRICRKGGLSCTGSLKALEKEKEALKVEEHGTIEDFRFTLKPVACMGACNQVFFAPADDPSFVRFA